MTTNQVASTFADPSVKRVDGDKPVILPGEDDVGTVRTWSLPPGTGQPLMDVKARFLGVGTSYTPQHRHDVVEREFARRDERCRACRWFEPRIFREVDGARRYLVHRIGMSIVPTEVPYASHEWVNGAFEVVEVLTTRRAGSRPYLTHPAARVLAQAADYDNELHNAYVNRAVA
jgi:hypothetical protein